ncbi:co-chaperone GroES [bacterium]|nr:co-chaperone GroES [bacterium]
MAKAGAKFGYRPAPGRLIVEPLGQKETTESGLYLPESAKERPQLGKVVAYTPGRDDNGKSKDALVEVGDVIFHSKYSGTEVKIDNSDFLILREDDILAVQN